MSDSETTSCCRCCTGFIFSSGLTALFLWLSLRPSGPTISIEEFYIPALNKTLNVSTNTSINFNLKLRNNNKDKGVNYDALNLTFYYHLNLTNPVATVVFPAFYQGHKKSAHRINSTDAVGVPWEDARGEVSNGTTVFRVDFITKVRYKIIFWRTKRRTIKVGSNLTVDDKGALVKKKKKGVKLSCAPVQVSYCARVSLLVGFLVVLLCF